MSRIVIVLVSLLVCRLSVEVYAQVQITFASDNCEPEDTATDDTKASVHKRNLILLYDKLTSESSSLTFYNYTVGTDTDIVYGLFQCRYDLSPDACNKCVNAGVLYLISECISSGEAIVWYLECMVRSASRDIFSLPETDPMFSQRNRVMVGNNLSTYDEFGTLLKRTFLDLNDDASSAVPHTARNKTNWAADTERLYSYAQCTPDIDTLACIGCLKTALAELFSCCSQSTGASVFMPSCQLRYSTTGPFLYAQSSPPPAPSNNQVYAAPETSTKTSFKPIIIAAIAACAAVGLLAISVVFWLCAYRRRPKEARGTSEAESIRDSEFVQYDFATLTNATRDFSIENKLGEGGFGSVYKGTLENGEQLAIKRLSGTSGQGTTEFMTEARFLAKLQHKNLVRLLGFCMEGEEKLLVYEFMPNASLDRFLFDATRRPLLNWVTRYKIIMGIARALQYLHEDSRLTIIHRDLKPANILLDGEMNPKIADFGLAKLFEVAQRIGNTSRIAGTPGYMAPEYMITGEYSVKSDVYSFGIMLLEIVSGRSNIKFYQSQNEDLPVHAWRLWNEDRLFDLTDSSLLGNCPSNSVMTRCIQIGLLCLQADAGDRPSIASVAFMLTGSSELPVPSAPAMSFPQFNIPRTYNSGVQSSSGQFSTKTISIRTNTDQDFHPKPI